MRIMPASAKSLPLSDLTRMVNDDRYVFEQKLDGLRMLVQYPSGVCLNKRGEVCSYGFDPESLNIERVPVTKCFFDGELIGGEFYCFDLIADDSVNYAQRRLRLDSVRGGLNVVSCAVTTKEKAAFAIRGFKEGWEGIMAKRLDLPYGASNAVYKLKFVKTIDCEVKVVGYGGKNNVALVVHGPDGKEVDVGGASMHGKKFSVAVGDVVEVQYLYATASSRLYQPTLIRKRTDKLGVECTADQLEYGNSKVIA